MSEEKKSYILTRLNFCDDGDGASYYDLKDNQQASIVYLNDKERQEIENKLTYINSRRNVAKELVPNYEEDDINTIIKLLPISDIGSIINLKKEIKTCHLYIYLNGWENNILYESIRKVRSKECEGYSSSLFPVMAFNDETIKSILHNGFVSKNDIEKTDKILNSYGYFYHLYNTEHEPAKLCCTLKYTFMVFFNVPIDIANKSYYNFMAECESMFYDFLTTFIDKKTDSCTLFSQNNYEFIFDKDKNIVDL